MALRQARMKTQSEALARDAEANALNLEQSYSRMKDAAASVSSLEKELREAIALTTKAAEAQAAKSVAIGKEAEKESRETENADALVNGFMGGIAHITENLSAQAGQISRTTGACDALSSGADAIAANIEKAVSNTGRLRALTGSGAKSMTALLDAMKRISETSEAMAEVVDVVEDFIEQTDLLSMNAAIEAAHAGTAGKGFAIISQEIKKLSASQKQQLEHIKNSMTAIVSQIREGAAQTGKVRKALSEITAGAAATAEQIEEIARESREQKATTGSIAPAMENLEVSSARVQEELRRQGEYAAQVRQAVSAIAEGAGLVSRSIQGVIEDNTTLAGSVHTLEELAGQSRVMIGRLVGAEENK
jgi:methyl-accepting chemotaxis protein